jgi:hydrogenase maturation protease
MDTRCVIGIGCDDHGDQIAGLLVAREVDRRARSWPLAGRAEAGRIDVVESSGAPAELVRAWSGYGHVVVVEAMPGSRPGKVHRCQPHPRPTGFGCSSIRLSSRLREALALGPLPERVGVITIEATCFVPHAPVTPPVAQAVSEIVASIAPPVEVGELAGARS